MSENLFRYQGCGLDNVYLTNGYRKTVSVTGHKGIFIEDIEGLHRAIAMVIVDSPTPLDAKTFKFLRKELDCSQRHLAKNLGVEEQTVSLWERARAPIPQSAEIFIRTFTKEICSGNAELMKIVERMNTMDRDDRLSIQFTKNDGHWEQAKAA